MRGPHPCQYERRDERLELRPRHQLLVADAGAAIGACHADKGRTADSCPAGSTFKEALEAYKHAEFAGLGFMFSSGDPYTGVDLDDCVAEDSEIELWALEIVRYFNSYTEFSATGTGLHIIVRGDVPNRRKGDLEVYSSKSSLP
jgi:primase-polymerase (primpol)-like protein